MFKKLSIFLSAILMVSLASLASATSAQKGEGITCLTKNSNVAYIYDKGRNGADVRGVQKVGKTHTSRTGSGFKGQCMGRCGGACGGWAPSAWAKDCLDHDICIVDQDGSNGLSNDPNCGDEFNQAADDYAFGVLRGCRG